MKQFTRRELSRRSGSEFIIPQRVSQVAIKLSRDSLQNTSKLFEISWLGDESVSAKVDGDFLVSWMR